MKAALVTVAVVLTFCTVNCSVTVPPATAGSSVNDLAKLRPATSRSSKAAGLPTAKPAEVAVTGLVVLV